MQIVRFQLHYLLKDKNMFTSKIIKVTKELVIDSNTEQFVVLLRLTKKVSEEPEEYEIIDRSLGYPITMSASEIKADIKKYTETFNLEQQQKEDNKELDAQAKQADETISSLMETESQIA